MLRFKAYQRVVECHDIRLEEYYNGRYSGRKGKLDMETLSTVGQLSLIHDDPGCGKKTLILSISASVTTGAALPYSEGTQVNQHGQDGHMGILTILAILTILFYFFSIQPQSAYPNIIDCLFRMNIPYCYNLKSDIIIFHHPLLSVKP